MTPESFSLVNVYRMDELVKGREGESKRTKSAKSADIELEITPKVDHKKVKRRESCYQHHRRHDCEARAQ